MKKEREIFKKINIECEKIIRFTYLQLFSYCVGLVEAGWFTQPSRSAPSSQNITIILIVNIFQHHCICQVFQVSFLLCKY